MTPASPSLLLVHGVDDSEASSRSSGLGIADPQRPIGSHVGPRSTGILENGEAWQDNF